MKRPQEWHIPEDFSCARPSSCGQVRGRHRAVPPRAHAGHADPREDRRLRRQGGRRVRDHVRGNCPRRFEARRGASARLNCRHRGALMNAVCGQERPPTAARFQASQRTSIAAISAPFFSAIALLSLVTCGVENRTREGGQRAGCSGKVFDWLSGGVAPCLAAHRPSLPFAPSLNGYGAPVHDRRVLRCLP
jgi:hypothetical protein